MEKLNNKQMKSLLRVAQKMQVKYGGGINIVTYQTDGRMWFGLTYDMGKEYVSAICVERRTMDENMQELEKFWNKIQH